MYSKTELQNLTKEQLIEIVLISQKLNNTNSIDRSFKLSSYIDNGHQKTKKCSLNIKIKGNVLKIETIFLTPSGYCDNGNIDYFEKILNKTQLNFLEKHTIEEFMVKFFNFQSVMKFNSVSHYLTTKGFPFTK